MYLYNISTQNIEILHCINFFHNLHYIHHLLVPSYFCVCVFLSVCVCMCTGMCVCVSVCVNIHNVVGNRATIVCYRGPSLSLCSSCQTLTHRPSLELQRHWEGNNERLFSVQFVYGESRQKCRSHHQQRESFTTIMREVSKEVKKMKRAWTMLIKGSPLTQIKACGIECNGIGVWR